MCEPAIVDLELTGVPESVTLVRAGLKGLGGLLELDRELLEDLQMAASEACNNVVVHAYGAQPGPMRVRVTATHAGIEMLVRDHGEGFTHPRPQADPFDDDGEAPGLGLAVIESLADDTQLVPLSGGTELQMRFERDIPTLHPCPHTRVAPVPIPIPLSMPGDLVATVSPVSLLAGVLERIARALAAQARFSVERFSDVHLVVDSLVGHAQRFAAHGLVSVAVGTEPRRLSLRIGPLRKRGGAPSTRLGSAGPLLRRLVDVLEVEPVDDSEVLHLTLSDSRPVRPARA